MANDQRFMPFAQDEITTTESQKLDNEQELPILCVKSPIQPVVLVVDDEAPVRKALKVVLENGGFEVLLAENGDRGFHLALQERPDIVITDYNMPGGSGHYMLTQLHTCEEARELPVIVLTGQKVGGKKDFALEREMMGRQGAKAYLTKPVDLGAVVAKVKSVLEIS